MAIKRGLIDISQITPGGLHVGTGTLDRVYNGTTLLWERGNYLRDELNATTNFTQTSTGSGVATSTGEALWNGTTDGQSTMLYNTAAITDNQYTSCIVGSTISTSRASGLIMHCDASLTFWYGLLFEGDRLTLISNTGRWLQNVGGSQDVAYTEWTGTVSIGDTLEFWNIGETFYASQNGTTRIAYTISGANISSSRRRQGFGMYRTAFASSGRIANWASSDAGAWGKI